MEAETKMIPAVDAKVEKATPEQSDQNSRQVADMALYNLVRAKKCMATLREKPHWDIADTASFDCMHYLGDHALRAAAAALDLHQGNQLLDIGSGFGATGRFLHSHYLVDVTGIELQPEIHALAEEITMRNGMAASVRSINGDFTKMALPGPVDHIVSFLCILHIADRDTLFKKAAAMLPTGGKMYIEDFFAREALTSASQDQLRDVVSCSYLPSEKRYLADMESAGFRDVHFQDVSAEWSDYVRARAIEYRKCASRQDAMLAFYDTVNELFASGQVGGVRITAAKA